jgi:hypothetical protein
MDFRGATRPGNAAYGREVIATVETEKGRNNIFLIKIMNQQHATWQGTVTLLGRKATRAAKLRGMSGGVDASLTFTDEADTLSFRSLLELIHMIDGALGDEKE